MNERAINARIDIPMNKRAVNHVSRMLDFMRRITNICEEGLEIIEERWRAEPIIGETAETYVFCERDFQQRWRDEFINLSTRSSLCRIHAWVKAKNGVPKGIFVFGAFDKWRTCPLPGKPEETFQVIPFTVEIPRGIWLYMDQERFIQEFLKGCITLNASYACIDSAGLAFSSPFVEYSQNETKDMNWGIPNVCWGQYITSARLGHPGNFEQLVQNVPCKRSILCESELGRSAWVDLDEELWKMSKKKRLEFRQHFAPYFQPLSIDKMASAGCFHELYIDTLPLLPEERTLLEQRRKDLNILSWADYVNRYKKAK